MSRTEEPQLKALANRMLADYDARNPGTAFSEGAKERGQAVPFALPHL